MYNTKIPACYLENSVHGYKNKWLPVAIYIDQSDHGEIIEISFSVERFYRCLAVVCPAVESNLQPVASLEWHCDHLLILGLLTLCWGLNPGLGYEIDNLLTRHLCMCILYNICMPVCIECVYLCLNIYVLIPVIEWLIDYYFNHWTDCSEMPRLALCTAPIFATWLRLRSITRLHITRRSYSLELRPSRSSSLSRDVRDREPLLR